MTHFGIICPAATGHLNRMTTLGNALIQRGHQVTLFGALDAQYKAELAGLGFVAIAPDEFPQGETKQLLSRLGKLSGIPALLATTSWIPQWVSALLREAPKAIAQAGVEALIVDQTALEGGSIADYLGIPFVNVCNIAMHQHESVPPYWTPWKYNTSRLAQLRNYGGYQLVNAIDRPIWRVIADYRRAWKLPPLTMPNGAFSKLAVLSQQPAEFDFPRRDLPPWFYYTGPYQNLSIREPISFPYERLNGKQLIYASLGTLQNRLLWIFERIAAACVGLDIQLVISLGGAWKPESLPTLPGNPIVVEYAPQLELMSRLHLMITHAGMNTALEALSHGVPMVAIPIANDQPGVAARIAWTGTGEVVPLSRLTVPRLHRAIAQVLHQPAYKENALRLQQAIQRAGGTAAAVTILERVATGDKFLEKPLAAAPITN